MEKLIELGLDQFSEAIGEISSAASKELAIEQALKGIADAWEAMELEISPYKDKGHYKLKYFYKYSLYVTRYTDSYVEFLTCYSNILVDSWNSISCIIVLTIK